MKHMVDDFAIYARQPRPGTDAARSISAALLLDVLALYDNLRPHVALALPRRAGRHPGRADPPAPGVPQSPAERRRCPGRRRRSALRDHARRATAAKRRSSFADGGPGFAEDVLAHAFEPYVTTKAKGTGLGLAIVKKIVDEHRGRVVLENAPPRGARVTLIFPAHARSRPQRPDTAASMAPATRNPDRRRRSRHPRAALRDPAGRGLSRGARRERRRGARVPRSASSRRWCCSTSGCPTPTASRCCANGAPPGQLTMPVVMMSGHGTIETAVEATKIGAFDFLEKPIGLQKLLSTIARALKTAAAQEPRRVSLAALGTSTAIREAERALEQLLAARKADADPGRAGHRARRRGARAAARRTRRSSRSPNGARLAAQSARAARGGARRHALLRGDRPVLEGRAEGARVPAAEARQART